MVGELQEKATAVFNTLNRHLSLINYTPPGHDKKAYFLGYDFKDSSPSVFEANHYKEFERIFTDISYESSQHPESNQEFNLFLRDFIWEQDGLGLDFKNSYYSNFRRRQSIESVILTSETASQSEEDSEDQKSISSLSSENAEDTRDEVYVGSADSNFVNYTYWAVETGDNVSTTTKPMYFNTKDVKVSLLEESEAFVAEAFWGNDVNLFKYTPRHLLLQVTQIANRAFFDPSYRKYLHVNYV